MKRVFSAALLVLALFLRLQAQEIGDSLASCVHRFGSLLPQEKVFLHTDNSSYFLGDTIFYKAYVTRSDNSRLSTLSGVLYVELLNHDGYLVDRQIVRLSSGMGHGSIVLSKGKASYAGYYELRAYTRWMLNFGRTKLPHKKSSEAWFVRGHMAAEYYVDYDKLYSRVFPVYDAPDAPGEYYRDMTLRPLQRLNGAAKEDDSVQLSLFPEGGYLTEDVPCRVFFEAMRVDGKHEEGHVSVVDDTGAEVAVAEVQHRGKGRLSFVPREGRSYKAVFTTADGRRSKASLPKALADGAALCADVTASALDVKVAGRLTNDLNLTVMHHGMVCRCLSVGTGSSSFSLALEQLPQGVLNLTLYNPEGRILADRLVFNMHGIGRSLLSVEGVQPCYAPYAPIDLTVRRVEPSDAKAVLSVSVVDDCNSDQSVDNANMLAEMLLCSEIKGFVENPDYYFAADDDVHRAHLDLLMGTQGWRRFSWRQQAHPELFNVVQLNEPVSPVLNGAVYNYEAMRKTDELQDEIEAEFQAEIEAGMALPSSAPGLSGADEAYYDLLARQGRAKETDGHGRYQKNPGRLKREVNVHAEFVSPGDEALVGDAVTENSMFKIQQPDLEGQFYMHLAAADMGGDKAKEDKISKYHWIKPDEEEYADFYVRLSDPFPRHVQPYSYYQTCMLQYDETQDEMRLTGSFADRMMSQVTITSRRNFKRAFSPSHPALALYGYTAFNMVCDAGLCPGQFVGGERFAVDIARLLMGDMGVGRSYNVILRRDGRPASHNMSVSDRARYDLLMNIDSVYVYTDYAPRSYGKSQWDSSEQPDVVVDLHTFKSGGRQVTYRDRFYVRQGFNQCEDFYSPDYSRMALPSAPRSDVRRTLLWLPYAMFDDNGELHVKAYNNGISNRVRVVVNGIDATGCPLVN